MQAKGLEIALVLIALCTAAAFSLRYFATHRAKTRRARISLLIGTAILGAVALTYHGHSYTATSAATYKVPEAARPAEPPDPMDVFHLRQRVCWNSTGTARG